MGLVGQLAFFADGHKSGMEFHGGGGGKNKSARVNAHDGIHRTGLEFFREQINRAGKQPRDRPGRA